ncbi:MAG TPA: proline--tRNA ligase, partial [Limnochordia bacterium]|nr:proline--tRNA ligase [Limnochordia bacterium]
VMAIVREELAAIGAQELLFPIVQPAELWEASGRWQVYGDEMFRLKDRHGRAYCLGPTHEEIVTALFRAEIRSYKQLPLALYQIQNKYRDEVRPRFGVMRSREFIMKDAYSFHRDEASLAETYRAMYDAYARIFARCGLKTVAVEADSGAIGGDDTHEFMVLADSGENAVVHCDRCNYAANVEKAECVAPADPPGDAAVAAPLPERVATPGAKSIEAVAALLGAKPQTIVKTLIYRLHFGGGKDDQTIAVLVRGDRQLNELKLIKAAGAERAEMADAAEVERVTGAPPGFAGPVGLAAIEIWADAEAAAVPAAITGANAADTHLTGVVAGRDYTPGRVLDLRNAEAHDPCPRCGQPLGMARGIEVGQVFKLGRKYSVAMDAAYLEEDGSRQVPTMGCYGIGITRTVAAVIEQHHDAAGIVWPVAVAPYQAVIIPVRYDDPAQHAAADGLFTELAAAGVEVALDDRAERSGVKFADAELIGFPVRITIGPRALAQGNVEVRGRETADVAVGLDKAVEHVRSLLAQAAATGPTRAQ